MALEKNWQQKKGPPNRRTIAPRDTIASGMSPLEFLCAVYRDSKQPMIRRIEAARSAALYLHPRLTVTLLEPLQHALNLLNIEVVFVDPPQSTCR